MDKKYEEMHTILNGDLSNFNCDLQNVATMRSIQISEIFDIFTITQHLCIVYLKN